MVNQCANPSCAKPLHYLREGRIFVFDLPDPDLPVPSSGDAHAACNTSGFVVPVRKPWFWNKPVKCRFASR